VAGGPRNILDFVGNPDHVTLRLESGSGRRVMVTVVWRPHDAWHVHHYTGF